MNASFTKSLQKTILVFITSTKRINLETIHNLRTHFYTGATLSYSHRLHCLKQFQLLLDYHKEELIAALQADFNKPAFETLATEIAMLQKELNYFKKHLKKWVAPKRVSSTLLNFPAKETISFQPFGVVLIIAPWNYPLLLALQPLMAALAAGNCAVLKPSELTTHTSALLKRLIGTYFSEELVQVIEGGVEETRQLLEQKFDKIFFTGSTSVGKIVHQAAAKNLTPVVLELGGKSPCVVTPSTNIPLAAKRIAFAKFVNAGQTCIAPDFVFIHPKVEKEFIGEMQKVLMDFYGEDAEKSSYFARIINETHHHRIKQYLLNGTVLIGGQTNDNTRYIAPTLLKVENWNEEVMQTEIFGPVLPLVNYEDINEIIDHNQNNEKPLAFYVFGAESSEIETLLNRCQYGGACVNDCLSHIINNKLPFGGIGASGFGNYHGKYSFEAFSQAKAVVYRKTWFDSKIKYPPYTKDAFQLLKKMMRFL